MKKIQRFLSLFLISSLIVYILTSLPLFNILSSRAEIPAYAKITQILGPIDITIRINQMRRKGGVNSRIYPTNNNRVNAIYMPRHNKTIGTLEFFDKNDESKGLTIQADTQNERTTAYYFPCTLENPKNAIIEWKNLSRGGGLACKKGVRTTLETRSKVELTESDLYADSRGIIFAKAASGKQSYCSVASESGESWYKVSASENPCQQALQECQKDGGDNCSALTQDFWKTSESELTAVVSCKNISYSSRKGSGAEMPDLIRDLWSEVQEKGGKTCVLNVLGVNEAIVLPTISSKRTTVEVNNIEPCLTFKPRFGTSIIKSTKKLEGVLIKPGNEYKYCAETEKDLIKSVNPENESIEMQVFLARERGYKLCDQQQKSGGIGIDKQTIQLTATEGFIKINYNMHTVPDRLIVTQKEEILYDTKDEKTADKNGYVSGKKTVSRKVNSGQVKVTVIGNLEKKGTKWDYTLRCPSLE